jgi:C4-dicarboxylate-specific signal transduction histidine kinase
MTALLITTNLLISSFILKYLWKWHLGYSRKISEHKKTIEKALQLATAGEVFASIGHDISNPLQVINLCVDRIRKIVNSNEVVETKRLNELLCKIQKMTNQSESVIRNMNLLLKDNSDYISMEFETNAMLSDLQELVQYRAVKSNVQILFINECEKLVLYTNPYALIQILTNLINNAIDALNISIEKRIEIVVREESSQILIIVQDTGPGVPKDIQEKVFETLFTTKQNIGGTGLGLSISKKIAERLHCALTLENSVKGARFVLKIPHTIIIKKN